MNRGSCHSFLCPLIFIAVLASGSFFQGYNGGFVTGQAYAGDSTPNEPAELVVQNPHAGSILSLAISPDNRMVASSGDDGMAKLWDVETGRLLRDLMQNQYFLHSVAFSPNGKILATGSGDHTVQLWRVESGEKLKVLDGHVHAVKGLAFSPDGRFLASGSRAYDKDPATSLFIIWDVSAGKAIHRINGNGEVKDLVFTPDGVTLVVAKQGNIALWDWRNERKILDLSESPDQVQQVALSPVGDRLAVSGVDRIPMGGGQATFRASIKLWNIKTGRLIKKARLPGGFRMLAMAFTADGNSLMLVRPDGIQYAGPDLNLSATPIAQGFKISRKAVLSSDLGLCAFTAQGGAVGFLRPSTGLTTRAKVPRKSLAVRAIAFSKDGGSLFAAMDDGTTKRWNIFRGILETSFPNHERAVHSMSVSSRDGSVVTAGYDGKILFWSPETQQMLDEIRIPHPGGTDPFMEQRDDSRRDLRSYPGATYPPMAPRHLRLADGPQLRSLVTSCLSPDGTRLAYGGYRYFVSVYDTVKKSRRQLTIKPESEFKAVNALAFDKDGGTLAIGDEGGAIVLWDMLKNKEKRRFKAHDAVSAIAFSPTEPGLLVTAGRDGLVNVWHSGSGKLFRTLKGHESPVLTITFSADGKNLASGGADGIINVWDITRGTKVKTAKGHAVAVNSLAYSPDGAMLASGGEDATVKFWDARSLLELTSVLSFDERNWLAFEKSGFFDGTIQSWQLCLFRFASEPMRLYEPEQFFAMFFQPGLLADVAREKKTMREILRRQGDQRASLDISAYRNSKLPQVRILSPADGTSSSERVVRITVEARGMGSGLQDLRIFRNQSLVHFRHGALGPALNSGAYRLDVPIRVIAGDNQIMAYAFNRDNIKSKDAKISITGKTNLKREGRAYILSIGINEYANRGYNLKFAVADTEIFTEKVGQSLTALGYHVITAKLIDREATREGILTALDRLSGRKTSSNGDPSGEARLLRRAEPEDIVIVHFSGHGTAQKQRYFIIPHDLGYSKDPKQIDEAGRNLILSRSLSDRDLEASFEGIDAERIMLIIDACQSGQALEAEEKRRGPMNSRGLAQLAYEKGMYILAAAQSREAALELSKLGHGLLTYVLIELGLEKFEGDRSPRDGMLTAEEWLDYASSRVPIEFEKAMAQHLAKTGKGVDYEEVTVTGQAPRAYYRREHIGKTWLLKREDAFRPAVEEPAPSPATPAPRVGGLKIIETR